MPVFSLSFLFLILSEALMTAGYAISFPFLAIYLNSVRNINMSVIGFFLSTSMLVSSLSNMYGGELSDKIGRKKVMLLSLLLRGAIVLIIAVIIAYNLPIIWLFVVHPMGLFAGALFNPAAKAWVAEIIKPEERLNAYGIMRIGTNLGWAIGPAIGGLVAVSSYSKMFFITATVYYISAMIIYLTLKDSNKSFDNKSNENRLYFSYEVIKEVFKDKKFLVFCFFSFIISSVMSQLIVPISLYSKKYLVFNEKEIGFLFTINGSMVVFMQYFVSRYFSKFTIVRSLSVGSLLYGIGYFMFGFSKVYYFAIFSMIVITSGELILSPALNTFVANIAAKNKEGRYIGIASMIHQTGNSFGIFLGSFLIDNFSKYYQPISWNFMLILGVLSFYGFKKLEKLEKNAGNH